MDNRQVVARHQQFLFPSVINYYAEPIPMAKAQGLRAWDVEGREYLDFFGGILTVSLGHCHPAVTDRIVAQARTLQHCSTLYPTEPIVDLAEKMAAHAPFPGAKVFFTGSGTEADETALLLARCFSGGSGDLLFLRHCYSGRSQMAMNVCGHSNWRVLPSQVPGIKHAHAPYCYRCAMGLSYPSCDLRCARDIEELIRTETCGRIAGFMAEPCLGVGGFILPPPGYFEVAVEIVRKYGGIFISDEVQTGFGRTGTKWNGIEHWNVVPDILTYAKGIANGLPLAATVARPEVAASLKGLSISTFGGNPLSSAAALATIEVMEQEDIPMRSERMGQRLRAGLDDLATRHAWVGEVRGMGLMQALELVEDRASRAPAPARAVALMEAAKAEGLLIGKGGLYGNVMRIAPPMLVSDAEMDEALVKLERAMEKVK